MFYIFIKAQSSNPAKICYQKYDIVDVLPFSTDLKPYKKLRLPKFFVVKGDGIFKTFVHFRNGVLKYELDGSSYSFKHRAKYFYNYDSNLSSTIINNVKNASDLYVPVISLSDIGIKI